MKSKHIVTHVIIIGLLTDFKQMLCDKSGKEEYMDVLEGDSVTLKCRFDPVPAQLHVTLYWIRNNKAGSDNAAIEDTSLDSSYRVERFPSLGKYDLFISRSTYERDNGSFKCMVKEAGTGNLIHTAMIGITILMKPSPPVISPKTPIVTEGIPVNLTCSTSGGSPFPEVKWYKEGLSEELQASVSMSTSREDSSSSVVTIIPTKADNGAIYRCTVWNRALGRRQQLESRTSLNVNYFPRVIIGPQNPLLIEEGDTAVMTCLVDAKPQVNSVKWTRLGRYIATTFRHVIPRVTETDDGDYYCEADNNLGRTGKDVLNISVLHGPRVTVKPFEEVDEGGSITVECLATANPKPDSYEWSKQNDATFEAVGKFLILQKVTPKESGNYTCVVKNILNPTTGSEVKRSGKAIITVAVKHAPGRAFVNPSDPVGVTGKSITLSCSSDPVGHPKPQFRWFRTDRPSEILATSKDLIIRPVRLSRSGQYSCLAENHLGEGAPATVNLQVVQAPKIVSGLPTQMIRRVGPADIHQVQISCRAIGKPQPSTIWLKNGVKIENGTSSDKIFDISDSIESEPQSGAFLVLSTLTLKSTAPLKGLVPEDAGNYSCQFNNTVGSVASSMSLMIEHPPIVIHKYKKVASDVGRTAVIQCKMKAFPTPKFQWRKDRALVSSIGRLKYQTEQQLSGTEFESLLKITSVKENSYGEYTCEASNTLGSTKTIVKLVKKGKPESPTNLKALETFANNVLVSWTENFNGGINNTSFHLQYREQGSTILQAEDITCAKSPCNVKRLDQHTSYILRVKAVNIFGESTWSDYKTMTTLVDKTKIPRPESLFYQIKSNTVTFHISNYPLNLVAKYEFSQSHESWQLLRTVFLKTNQYKFSLSSFPQFNITERTNIRVKICLQADSTLCGPYSTAVKVGKLSGKHAKVINEETSWLVAVIVGVILTLLISLMILVKCCWSSKSKGKTVKRDELLGASRRNKELMLSNRPDIVHPSLSGDLLGAKLVSVQTGKDASFCDPGLDINKSRDCQQIVQQYGNSQESLWMANGGDCPADNHSQECSCYLQYGYPPLDMYNMQQIPVNLRHDLSSQFVANPRLSMHSRIDRSLSNNVYGTMSTQQLQNGSFLSLEKCDIHADSMSTGSSGMKKIIREIIV